MQRLRQCILLHSQRTFSTFKQLPVIDVAPLVAPSGSVPLAKILQVAAELHAACRDVGFFYIRNAMAADTAVNVRQQARAWFALPESKKREILLSPQSHYRGYQPLGVNVTQGAR